MTIPRRRYYYEVAENGIIVLDDYGDDDDDDDTDQNKKQRELLIITTHPHSIFARATRVARRVARVENSTPSNRNGKEEWKYCPFTRTSEGISWPKESK
jgi:hypothetical protein